jgi:EmrB/QacA subfamily drug resistance transporter
MKRLEYKWLVGIAFVFGLVMDLLDTTIVNVALPDLQREFGVGVGTIEWVVTGYLLSLAVFIPVSGYLSDRFGSKRIYLGAIALFTLASGLCGLSPNEQVLILCRVLQGAGGGLMVPVGAAMLFREFPPEERATASSVLAIPTVLAPMLGPVVGGALVEFLDWRWIFWVNLPVGAAAFLFSWQALREHVEPEPGRFDPAGLLLAAGGLTALLYGLSVAAQPGEGLESPKALACMALGGVLLAALVRVELRRPHAMLDLRLLRDYSFGTGNLLAFVVFAAVMGTLFLYPLFLQNPSLMNLTPLESGLITFPQALGVMAIRPFSGRLFNRLGGKPLIVVGTALLVASTAVFTQLDVDTAPSLIRGTLFLRGVGTALIYMTVETVTFYTIPNASMGRASSFFNVTRQVASSVGVALLATVLTIRTAHHSAHGRAEQRLLVSAFDDAFWVATGLAIIGLLIALLMRVPKVAPPPDHTRTHPIVAVH